jgi:peptidyl-prolyl cis-trans isomerase C
MLLGGEKQAREADRLLRRGEPFADVAKSYSVSPEGAGARYFEYTELPEYLQPQLAGLEAGMLTRPIAVSPDLFQIILVVQRAEGYALPLEAVSGQIRLQLTDEEGNRAYQAYLAGLRQRFLVQVFWAKLPFQYVKEAP